MRKRTEDFHHTDEQVADCLARAHAILEASPLSWSERVAVLPTVVSLLASKQLFYEEEQKVMTLDPRLLGGGLQQ